MVDFRVEHVSEPFTYFMYFEIIQSLQCSRKVTTATATLAKSVSSVEH